MKLTLKQLKNIIKEEMGNHRQPELGMAATAHETDWVEQVMSEIQDDVDALVQSLSQVLAEKQMPPDPEVTADAFMPEVSGDVEEAVRAIISNYE